MSTTISNKLQTIYTIKQQIKQVIGTQSDIFTDYPTLIQNAINSSSGSGGNKAALTYVSANGFDTVGTPVYDGEDVFESMTVSKSFQFGDELNSNDITFRTNIPFTSNYYNIYAKKTAGDDLSDNSYHNLTVNNNNYSTITSFYDKYGDYEFLIVNDGTNIKVKQTQYTAPAASSILFSNMTVSIYNYESENYQTINLDYNEGSYEAEISGQLELNAYLQIRGSYNGTQYQMTGPQISNVNNESRTIHLYPAEYVAGDSELTGVQVDLPEAGNFQECIYRISFTVDCDSTYGFALDVYQEWTPMEEQGE